MVVPFKNEPGIDFSVQANVERFNEELRKVKAQLGQDIPLVINGEKLTKTDTFNSVNPANTSQLIAKVSKATQDDVEKPSNQQIMRINHGRSGRIRTVQNYCYVAAIIRRRKEEISAIMVYEAGKPWDEAVGDAAEGIDFIEYYAKINDGTCRW